MYERLYPTSIYYRYLSYSIPATENPKRICQINGRNGAVFVATIEEPVEMVVGLAYYRYVENRQRLVAAEPGLLIEDRFQQQGIGSTLYSRLCEHAQFQGVCEFSGIIYAGNLAMIRIIRNSGYRYQTRFSNGVCDFRMWLDSAQSRY
jgi:L-amino acid N-acyltransferase YncA